MPGSASSRNLVRNAGQGVREIRKALGPHADSGYNIARMRFEIILATEAVQDLKHLKALDRAAVRDAIEVHLRHQPTRTSRSHIRVFYDVTEMAVEILAIVPKSDGADWLEKAGSRS